MDERELVTCLREARERTLALVAGLSHEEMIGPRLEIVNPFLWEIGHVAWFQERFCLRHLTGRGSILDCADGLYDSISVHHETRWGLDLLPLEGVQAYMADVLERVTSALSEPSAARELRDLATLSLFHEDMHVEAFCLMRQTLGYPVPTGPGIGGAAPAAGTVEVDGDVAFEGGRLLLGSERSARFTFDNEHGAHECDVPPFRLARRCVTQEEFAAFVDEGGYGRREWWSDEGWRWRESVGAAHPVYWRRQADGSWLRRHFHLWKPLEARVAVCYVSAHEAEAYCRWAGRRLPSEAEWEWAAGPTTWPWGEEPPSPERAHLDHRSCEPCCVHAHAAGDTPEGVRQMIGNVWEWTSTPFAPYPGFVPGVYREYSQPWFHTRRVLRGGSFATRSRMIRSRLRNFYEPERRDVPAGFRTAAAR